MSSDTLIVTGASGKLGRLVLAHLRTLHTGPIVATTRDPAKITDMPGIDVRRGDFEDTTTLDTAFAGGDRLLLISTDAVGGDGQRVAQHCAAIEAAKRAGISHIVYTSLTRPEPGAIITIAPDHYATEQALDESGLGWTSLRDNLYADLLPEFLGGALRSGVLAAAAGDGTVGWVTREDCARTAADILAKPPAGGTVLDVTGPTLVGYAEIAALASKLVGRPIVYRPTPAQDVEAGMAKAGLPPHVIALLVSFQLATARGDLAVLSDTVLNATGKTPIAADVYLATQTARLGVAQ